MLQACISQTTLKSIKEPLVGELVHMVQLVDLVRQEVELGTSLRDWLVQSSRLNHFFHGFGDFIQGLSDPLSSGSTRIQLLD